jgi:hypothetical protein
MASPQRIDSDSPTRCLPMAVIKDLGDGLSTLPAWAAPIAKKITTSHPF